MPAGSLKNKNIDMGQHNGIKLAVLDEKITGIQSDVAEIKSQMHGLFVTQDQFTPVKTLVYGLTGLMLTTVVGAILMLVIRGAV